jgi:hypothetical protein
VREKVRETEGGRQRGRETEAESGETEGEKQRGRKTERLK